MTGQKRKTKQTRIRIARETALGEGGGTPPNTTDRNTFRGEILEEALPAQGVP